VEAGDAHEAEDEVADPFHTSLTAARTEIPGSAAHEGSAR
jgi:hypothetical protein